MAGGLEVASNSCPHRIRYSLTVYYHTVDSQVVLHTSIRAHSAFKKRALPGEGLPVRAPTISTSSRKAGASRVRSHLTGRYSVPPHEQYLCPRRSTCQ